MNFTLRSSKKLVDDDGSPKNHEDVVPAIVEGNNDTMWLSL